jgi:Tfp pilus assembly protein PilF
MAVEAQPFNAEFLARLGYVYQAVGLDGRAQHYFGQALAKDPKQAIARAHHRPTQKGSGGLLGALKRLVGG